MSKVLNIKNLKVTFNVPFGTVKAVRGVSLSIESSETLAIVGESGCGKSALARSILKLHNGSNVYMEADELKVGEKDILKLTEEEMLKVRGQFASMIFQDPLSYFNPTMKIGKQVTEALLIHKLKTKEECREEAIRLLEMVQIPSAKIRAEQYPHEFSGGMRQRAMIAMALSCNPLLLIADEPTTALDPTIQLQILALLKSIQKEHHTSILLITHDLSVVANVADNVAVMYAGEIVEKSSVDGLFSSPMHPYTRGLLESLPALEKDKDLYAISGAPPDLFSPPRGCAFASRCSECMEICTKKSPPEFEVNNNHMVSCWLMHKDCPRKEKW